MSSALDRRLSRRRFLGASAAGGAALLMGGGASSALAYDPPTDDAIRRARRRDEDEDWFEASFRDLQRLMRRGEISSVGLTKAYLRRIRDLNPILGAVIETNPHALRIAAQRDRERRRHRVRGPLHGIPILVKDNIATNDRMETTAGSLALEGSRVRRDADIVTRLRRAGAVILGKANLSEWANFRGFIPPGFPNGWSARGSFTRDPYVLSWDPCGSSSGSAVAAAANLCAGAVGTETDGSILCPAGNNNVVGLKPTLGLVSQRGIIPIAHSQDTAGPMTRTVADAALMLNALK
jgi:amidase